jgi:UDP-N-acetylglucosamine 2-epimerase (non-hydrolysing)
MKILSVVGARPNFMKIAPLIEALRDYPDVEITLLHTGQHYDYRMSALFFRQLEIPAPDIYLGVGGGTHAEQTAKIMLALEPILFSNRADLVIVVGDVNSTLAVSLTAAKLNIKIAHIEAGLRSFDRTMPEEINRTLTDHLSSLLFTTCEEGNKNLRHEGIAEEKIHFVGNVMIDTLIKYKDKTSFEKTIERLNLSPAYNRGELERYALITLHRPSNVDDKGTLSAILEALSEIASEAAVIFPAHPRTVKKIEQFNLNRFISDKEVVKNKVTLFPPLGYLDFISLMKKASLVLTDSGGIQEETTFLKIPCLTLRENTERRITITIGTNKLVGKDKERITAEAKKVLKEGGEGGEIPPLWDGKASLRIARIISESRL